VIQWGEEDVCDGQKREGARKGEQERRGGQKKTEDPEKCGEKVPGLWRRTPAPEKTDVQVNKEDGFWREDPVLIEGKLRHNSFPSADLHCGVSSRLYNVRRILQNDFFFSTISWNTCRCDGNGDKPDLDPLRVSRK
jgi:hypothetical protein